jgi:hypothetical protein
MSCMSNLDFAGSVTVTHTQDEEPQDTTQVQAEAEALGPWPLALPGATAESTIMTKARKNISFYMNNLSRDCAVFIF